MDVINTDIKKNTLLPCISIKSNINDSTLNDSTLDTITVDTATLIESGLNKVMLNKFLLNDSINTKSNVLLDPLPKLHNIKLQKRKTDTAIYENRPIIIRNKRHTYSENMSILCVKPIGVLCKFEPLPPPPLPTHTKLPDLLAELNINNNGIIITEYVKETVPPSEFEKVIHEMNLSNRTLSLLPVNEIVNNLLNVNDKTFISFILKTLKYSDESVQGSTHKIVYIRLYTKVDYINSKNIKSMSDCIINLTIYGNDLFETNDVYSHFGKYRLINLPKYTIIDFYLISGDKLLFEYIVNFDNIYNELFSFLKIFKLKPFYKFYFNDELIYL